VPFCGFNCKEGDGSNVVTFFYSGGDVKKAMATSNFFFFLGSLWFNLLKLTINNIMVVCLLRLKVIMARGRGLKKSDGGDLEVHKQNVASSDQVVAKETVVSSNQLKIVIFSHQAPAEGIVTSSDEPINEQNVIPSKLKLEKQNVASSDMKIKN